MEERKRDTVVEVVAIGVGLSAVTGITIPRTRWSHLFYCFLMVGWRLNCRGAILFPRSHALVFPTRLLHFWHG